jgi:urea transport system permease protein
LVAIRDDEDRVRFLGYDPVMIKTVAFIISAILAGIAGALFVPQVGIISPSVMEVVFSIEVVIWVAVGGRGTLVGAVIGTLLVNWGRSLFSEQFPDIWQYFLGGLFIVVVLVFPQGIVGTIRTYWGRLRSRRQVVPEPARAAAGNALQQQPRTGESA